MLIPWLGLVESLPTIHEVLGLFPKLHKPGIRAQTCSPSTEEVQAGESEDQDHSQLRIKFKITQSYMRPCFKRFKRRRTLLLFPHQPTYLPFSSKVHMWRSQVNTIFQATPLLPIIRLCLSDGSHLGWLRSREWVLYLGITQYKLSTFQGVATTGPQSMSEEWIERQKDGWTDGLVNE